MEENEYLQITLLWARRLGLTDWKITLKGISRAQVMFPDDISEEDRYWVGISTEIVESTKHAEITYDRPLTEEDIVHELLHICHPDESEDWINVSTANLLVHYSENKSNQINVIVSGYKNLIKSKLGLSSQLDEAIFTARRKICDACEHRTKLDRCGKCGCPLGAKTRSLDPASKCPEGHW